MALQNLSQTGKLAPPLSQKDTAVTATEQGKKQQ